MQAGPQSRELVLQVGHQRSELRHCVEVTLELRDAAHPPKRGRIEAPGPGACARPRDDAALDDVLLHPGSAHSGCTAKIVEIVRSGVLGEIRLIQAAFGFNAGFNPTSRLWANAAGGGGILDVGCYPVSMARLVAGAAGGRPFADPVAVTGVGQLHPETGVDVVAAATLKFAGGIVAQVATSVGVHQDSSLRIYGTAGMLHVPSPWIPPSDGVAATMTLTVGGKAEEITVAVPDALYGLEADAVAALPLSAAAFAADYDPPIVTEAPGLMSSKKGRVASVR